MKIFILMLFGILFFNSCNEKVNNIANKTLSASKIEGVETKLIKEVNPLSKKIIGIWTSEGSINADFKIDDKTFYYVEDFANYEYSLKGNEITIKYPDFIYKGKVSFKGDTLILSTEERIDKYWKFKD